MQVAKPGAGRRSPEGGLGQPAPFVGAAHDDLGCAFPPGGRRHVAVYVRQHRLVDLAGDAESVALAKREIECRLGEAQRPGVGALAPTLEATPCHSAPDPRAGRARGGAIRQ